MQASRVEELQTLLEWNRDLNFAYDPSCAYDPRWACPLAPPA